MKGHLSTPVLWLLLLSFQDTAGAEELRLANGGSPCAGRVEVKHQDQWGTVCDDGWDMADAGVVCKQLGCGAAVSADDQAHFGAGSGKIWLDEVACDGTESALWHCGNEGFGESDCSHAEDAGVTCSGHIELQLVGGESACSGRVEVRHEDTWATICDAHFDLKAASVICNGLQCGTALSIPGGAHFREGHGPIWTEEFQCVGNESHLVYCPRISHGSQTCSHANDASVICSRLTGFRLVNGSTACSGRVEIQVLGAWGTLCDSRWDLPDANVLCRQLDCGFAVSNPGGGYFGKGTGSVWTDTFHCKGTEPHLGHCPVTALGASPCSQDNDAGVICSEFKDLRLVSDSDCAGRLEVFYNGTWGSVCSNAMSGVTPTIVCKQLNCGDGGQIARDFEYGPGSGPTWLDHVACSEQHSSLWQCPSEPWNPKSCDNRAEETHISCTGKKAKPPQTLFVECPNSTSCTDQEKLRVVGGEDRCSGRVEVWYRGFWGTVCDDSWDMVDANVVCKQLGCGSALSAPGEAAFGEGTGPIWVETLNCRGTESSLWDCPAKPWGESNCGHKEDAAVNCSGLTERTDSLSTPAPPRRPPTDSGRVTVPVVVCIILGALLCLVLIILGAQVRSARAQRRGSRKPLDPFSEAVYEEIDYNLMREKQEMFSRSVSYSDDSVTKLQYYTGDSEGENDPGSEQEGVSPRGSQLDYDNVEEPALNDVPQTPEGRDAPALPGDVPGDGYDDAREVSDPEGDTGLGQNDEEGTEASDRNGDSQTGWNLHSLRNEGVSGMEKETPFLPPGDTTYDDVGHGDSRRSVSEQCDWTK
ncbi:antigen WC1.1-like isoform X18 [Chelonia mydas]|uniref:antigen WC1.1-like isoform X18 n=1 Tax=Chelonia mydas TaxID=8469 RepID=UPI001CA7C713|nr:antigen WC1.1-like isoform X18 [Chelonia mydas]